MSTGTASPRRQVIEIIARSSEVNVPSDGSYAVPVGSELRLVYSAPSGRQPADFAVESTSTAVRQVLVTDVIHQQGQRPAIGEGTTELILTADASGPATVTVTSLDYNGQGIEAIVYNFVVG